MHIQAPWRSHIGDPQQHAAARVDVAFEGRHKINQHIQLQMFGDVQDHNAVEAALLQLVL